MRMRTDAIIFDMDGTMIDSMPWHAQAWVEFARRRDMDIDVPDLMARTTGRNGTECIVELLGRPVSQDEADALTHEKETIYRELFAPRFSEVAGFRQFAAQVRARGLKVAVGTAGDIGNVEFALGHLGLEPAPQAIVRGDEGLPGKPQPAIFLEAARRIAAAPSIASSLKTRLSASRQRAAQACVPWPSAAPTRPNNWPGPMCWPPCATTPNS